MANMGYCAFRNTLSDLEDCLDRLNDECSEEEHRARRHLVDKCAEILAELGFDMPDQSDIAEACDALPVTTYGEATQ